MLAGDSSIVGSRMIIYATTTAASCAAYSFNVCSHVFTGTALPIQQRYQWTEPLVPPLDPHSVF